MEAAPGCSQLPLQPARTQACGPCEPTFAREPPCGRAEAEQLGVIVQHLFEVRDEPGCVRTVAREATSELIEDSTGAHPPEGIDRQFARGLLGASQQEPERAERRELRRAAEPTMHRVCDLLKPG